MISIYIKPYGLDNLVVRSQYGEILQSDGWGNDWTGYPFHVNSGETYTIKATGYKTQIIVPETEGTTYTLVEGEDEDEDEALEISKLSNGTDTFSFADTFARESKEDKGNKVTSLSVSSTDTQYPSAKCVYDLVGDIETLINAL